MAQYARQRARLRMAPPPQPAGPSLTSPTASSSRKSSSGVDSKKPSMLSPQIATTTTTRGGLFFTASPLSEADTLVTSASSRVGVDPAMVSLEDEDDDVRRESEECGRWSVVLGFGSGLGGARGKKRANALVDDAAGFLYDPRALREAMFGGGEEDERLRKKQKVSSDVFEKRGMVGKGRSLLLENEDEL